MGITLIFGQLPFRFLLANMSGLEAKAMCFPATDGAEVAATVQQTVGHVGSPNP